MDFSETCEALNNAVREVNIHQVAIQENAAMMGPLLVGHLRQLWPDTLSALKRELRNYNIHTGKWRGEK